MTPRLFFLVLLVGTSVLSARAQGYTDSHLQAAEELLVAAGTETMMGESTESMLQLQLQQMPEIAPFEDVMRSFLREHVSWEALRDDLVQIYAESFTETELRDILAFYQTETGQKAIRLMPDLMARGMALGQQAVVEHQAELEARIQARANKLSGQKVPPSRPRGSR